MEFSRGDRKCYDDVLLLVGTGKCIVSNFSVLISSTVNINKYNPHKQKLFGVLNNF